MRECAGMSLGRSSVPCLGEALAVLDPFDVFETLFSRSSELGTVSLRPPPLACKRPVPIFERVYRRACSGFASRSRPALHVQLTSAPPDSHHLLVGEVEGTKVELILAERPQLLGKRPLSTLTSVMPATRARSTASAF